MRTIIHLFERYEQMQYSFAYMSDECREHSKNYKISMSQMTIECFDPPPQRHIFSLAGKDEKLMGFDPRSIVVNPWLLTDRLKAKFY